MIRIDRSTLMKLWIILRAGVLSGLDYATCLSHVSRNARDGRDANLADETNGDESLEELEELIKLLLTSKDKADDGRLFEIIVEFIQSPYSRNQFDGRTLEALRKSLLLPRELAALRSKLEKAEGKCLGCGKMFQSGEIATFHNDLVNTPTGSRVSHPIWYCIQCVPPRTIACREAGCQEKVALQSKTVGALTNPNIKCATHTKRKESDDKSFGIIIPSPPGGQNDSPRVTRSQGTVSIGSSPPVGRNLRSALWNDPSTWQAPATPDLDD